MKELRQGLCIFKNLALIFPVGRLQSVLIFSIPNHPLSFLVYYHFFTVFLSYKMNIMQARREGGCDGCARTPPPADCWGPLFC